MSWNNEHAYARQIEEATEVFLHNATDITAVAAAIEIIGCQAAALVRAAQCVGFDAPTLFLAAFNEALEQLHIGQPE